MTVLYTPAVVLQAISMGASLIAVFLLTKGHIKKKHMLAAFPMPYYALLCLYVTDIALVLHNPALLSDAYFIAKALITLIATGDLVFYATNKQKSFQITCIHMAISFASWLSLLVLLSSLYFSWNMQVLALVLTGFVVLTILGLFGAYLLRLVK